MIVGIPKETLPSERRVALTPNLVPNLIKSVFEVQIEAGAGVEAGYPDQQYLDKGATIAASRKELFANSQVIVQVNTLGANSESGMSDLDLLTKDQTVIGFGEPLTAHESTKQLQEKGISYYAMELIPRITRAQSMDTLSSMATIAGYKAVLIGADSLPKMFPMLMTAAGTLTAAKVFVVGAGVAGLQALATARRLGAITSAYDVRPAVKEQVQSVGAKFVEMEEVEAKEAEGKGGYAKEMDEEFYRKQREMMKKVLKETDVVITTAAIPGKKAPLLVTTEMVEVMPPGSVVVDLAAERGGNCELTKAGETVHHNGVTILGPVNLPSTVPFHASQMYGKNLTTFLLHLVKDDKLQHELDDEIIKETQVTHAGEVTNARVRELMGLEPLQVETKTEVKEDAPVKEPEEKKPTPDNEYGLEDSKNEKQEDASTEENSSEKKAETESETEEATSEENSKEKPETD